MTEEEFAQQCTARLAEIDNAHPDMMARAIAFNKSLADMRRRHAILIDKPASDIFEIQCYALMVDINEGRATYRKNAFGKSFYKYK